MKLCECGCGLPAPIATWSARRKGWVKGQPKRFIYGHWRKPERYEERDCGYTTPCWVWLGAKNSQGYGYIMRDRAPLRIHRVFYERARGPIPEGHDVDHLCRNLSCINPDHLEPVTEAENTRRGRSAKLNWEQVNEIRERIARGEVQADIARTFKVSQQLICDIKMGRKWVAS